jgi:anaphase-promoting complex subunit 3
MSEFLLTVLLFINHRYTGRKKAAIEHFTQALAADPLLWVAYEELCALGWCMQQTLNF